MIRRYRPIFLSARFAQVRPDRCEWSAHSARMNRTGDSSKHRLHAVRQGASRESSSSKIVPPEGDFESSEVALECSGKSSLQQLFALNGLTFRTTISNVGSSTPRMA
jgi:hypothetical protein